MRPTRIPRRKAWTSFSGLILSVILTSCSAGPDYVRPSAPEPAKYKELKKGWKQAAPRDDIDRGPWWAVFKDSRLDSYESQVEISNQTVAAAEAAYRQAQAIVKEAQAGLFPTVSLSYDVTRSGFGPRAFGSAGASTSSTAAIRTLSGTFSTLSFNGTWNVDLWGKIRRMVESDVSAAQASNADLANAKLSAQGMLATAYYNLLAADALEDLLNRLVKSFRSTLEITENQYKAGTVSKADVATARAQVYSTESQAIAVGITRAQFEHAIAVLMGKPPEELTVPHTPLGYRLPSIPPGFPSALLERRPDIAAAERAMQQQNALIGAAVALYYPDITLSGVFGFMGQGGLALAAANEFWTIGASAVQNIFNAGLTSAQVEAAKAIYDQSVGTYRQTVLTGFQQVDDQLAAIRILARQQKAADEAVKSSQEEYDVFLRQYRAGTVNFVTVNVAQGTLLTNSEAALAVRQNRFLAAVALIQALGGGWDASQLPSNVELETRDFFIPPI
jgi:NodT family efflux transporter outer membrane factor (OMF) lipoprotein